jgi:hypothetical protein
MEHRFAHGAAAAELSGLEHAALGVEPATFGKIVFGGYHTMDRYLLPQTNVANIGAIPAWHRP